MSVADCCGIVWCVLQAAQRLSSSAPCLLAILLPALAAAAAAPAGSFKTAKEAALSYDAAARILQGPAAVCNPAPTQRGGAAQVRAQTVSRQQQLQHALVDQSLQQPAASAVLQKLVALPDSLFVVTVVCIDLALPTQHPQA
jgi:hypothetical protein